MRLLVCAFVCVFSVIAVGGAISAAEWATLKGKFVYDGTPPAPKTAGLQRGHQQGPGSLLPSHACR